MRRVLHYSAFNNYNSAQKANLEILLANSQLSFKQIAVLFSDEHNGGLIPYLVANGLKDEQSAKNLSESLMSEGDYFIPLPIHSTSLIENRIGHLGLYNKDILEKVRELTQQYIENTKGQVNLSLKNNRTDDDSSKAQSPLLEKEFAFNTSEEQHSIFSSQEWGPPLEDAFGASRSETLENSFSQLGSQTSLANASNLYEQTMQLPQFSSQDSQKSKDDVSKTDTSKKGQPAFLLKDSNCLVDDFDWNAYESRVAPPKSSSEDVDASSVLNNRAKLSCIGLQFFGHNQTHSFQDTAVSNRKSSTQTDGEKGQLNSGSDALSDNNSLVEQDSNDTTALLARAYENKTAAMTEGKNELIDVAIKDYEHVLKIDPDNKKAKEGIEELKLYLTLSSQKRTL